MRLRNLKLNTKTTKIKQETPKQGNITDGDLTIHG